MLIEENECLLSLHWIHKLYKNPSKAWFIMATQKCSLKLLWKSLTSAFKLIFRHIILITIEKKYQRSVETGRGLGVLQPIPDFYQFWCFTSWKKKVITIKVKLFFQNSKSFILFVSLRTWPLPITLEISFNLYWIFCSVLFFHLL